MKKDERIIIKELANKLGKLTFSDQSMTDNYWLDEFFSEYMKNIFHEFKDSFEFVIANQKTKKQSYDDIDYSLIFHNAEYKEPNSYVKDPFRKGKRMNLGGTKHALISIEYVDHCSCAEQTHFLIQKDSTNFHTKYHLRILYDHSDYRKGNQYVHSPNLKWYKDRGFYIGYIDKLHMTPLGGCYGDLRDDGFIATFMENDYGRETLQVERGTMPNYHYYKMIVRSLQGAKYELKEENN